MIQLDWFPVLATFRRHTASILLFTVGLVFSLTISACTSNNAADSPATPANNSGSNKVTVQIGYQKSGTLTFVKAQGSLEKRLASTGNSVRWIEFPSGPPLLEAMNAGSIDFGHTGDAPPIFAQAAGIPMLYVAATPPSPEGSAILVRNNSPLQRVADLKGKKVAFAKGSSAHNLVVQALTAAGLQYSDIQPKLLAPADARAAFEQGSVDAWAIWDPFFAAAQRATGARVLVDGKNLVSGREFYLASRAFTSAHPELVELVVEEINQAGNWAKENSHRAAEFLAPQLGIDLPSMEQAERRRKRYGVKPVTEAVVAEQQKVADTFLRLQLIPKPINVQEVIWTPKA